jgi:hypothetical protein
MVAMSIILALAILGFGILFLRLGQSGAEYQGKQNAKGNPSNRCHDPEVRPLAVNGFLRRSKSSSLERYPSRCHCLIPSAWR